MIYYEFTSNFPYHIFKSLHLCIYLIFLGKYFFSLFIPCRPYNVMLFHNKRENSEVARIVAPSLAVCGNQWKIVELRIVRLENGWKGGFSSANGWTPIGTFFIGWRRMVFTICRRETTIIQCCSNQFVLPRKVLCSSLVSAWFQLTFHL